MMTFLHFLTTRHPLTYKESGVDIEAGNSLVSRIKSLSFGTHRSGVLGEIGSFGGLMRLNDIKYVNSNGEESNYKDIVLVQGTGIFVNVSQL